MPFISGVIDKIYIDELPEPDRFQNKFKRALIVDKQRFGAGTGKQPYINVKQGKDWYSLKEGDIVELRYTSREYKGKEYYDADVSTIAVTGKSDPAATAPSVGESPKSNVTQAVGVPRNRIDVGIKVGHSLNNAVHLCIAKAEAEADIGNLSLKSIEETAWAILDLSEKMNNEYESRSASRMEKANTSRDADGATSTKPVSIPNVNVIDDDELF